MKPTEAILLARYIKGHFPHQPVDEFTADALGETLANYPLADARIAVLRMAERGEEWCAPAAVKAEVKRIREKRVHDYGPIEPPAGLDPDDTRGYQRWLSGMTKKIADGEITAPPAIEYDRRNVIGELGQVGQDVPDA